jgi:hypothetical protein
MKILISLLALLPMLSYGQPNTLDHDIMLRPFVVLAVNDSQGWFAQNYSVRTISKLEAPLVHYSTLGMTALIDAAVPSVRVFEVELDARRKDSGELVHLECRGMASSRDYPPSAGKFNGRKENYWLLLSCEDENERELEKTIEYFW